jgi:cytochrome c556
MKSTLCTLFASAAITLSALAGAAVAQDSPQVIRENLMKDIGKSSKVVGDMLQGKAAYDAAAAKAALETIAKDAADFPNHFPEGSDTGETEALPAIWQNKADFDAKAKKLADDATAAAAATATGEDAFKAAAGAMFGNCKGCHEVYRKPS